MLCSRFENLFDILHREVVKYFVCFLMLTKLLIRSYTLDFILNYYRKVCILLS